MYTPAGQVGPYFSNKAKHNALYGIYPPVMGGGALAHSSVAFIRQFRFPKANGTCGATSGRESSLSGSVEVHVLEQNVKPLLGRCDASGLSIPLPANYPSWSSTSRPRTTAECRGIIRVISCRGRGQVVTYALSHCYQPTCSSPAFAFLRRPYCSLVPYFSALKDHLLKKFANGFFSTLDQAKFSPWLNT
jgi:hypothetical protein